MATKTLFEPVKIGSLALKNRVVMAPMTRNRASRDGVPSKLAVTYYAQPSRRAPGTAGPGDLLHAGRKGLYRLSGVAAAVMREASLGGRNGVELVM